MRTATIVRQKAGTYDDEGTFGTWFCDKDGGNWECDTLQNPWRDNQHDISCIPEGIYLLQWDASPEFGMCYHFRNVPGRDLILLHSGNLGGDESKGWLKQIKGCTVVGANIAIFGKGSTISKHLPPLPRDQKGVAASIPTLQELCRRYRDADGVQQDIMLTIKREA